MFLFVNKWKNLCYYERSCSALRTKDMHRSWLLSALVGDDDAICFVVCFEKARDFNTKQRTALPINREKNACRAKTTKQS